MIGFVQMGRFFLAANSKSAIRRSIHATGASRAAEKSVGVIGAPFGLGQSHQGVTKAPELIRRTGVFENLSAHGFDVKDYGDLRSTAADTIFALGSGMRGARNFAAVSGYSAALAASVANVISSGRICVTLGGDHSVAIGTLSGHLEADPDACVIWVDAHPDINTGATSASGNMHGMPVALNLTELRSSETEKIVPNPGLDASRIAFIGLRDIDIPEREVIAELDIPTFTMREVDSIGIRECLARALDRINPDGSRSIHISFDIDALDPTEAPATGTSVRGGLTLREAMTLLEDCHATGLVRAVDLVEVNTDLAEGAKGADLTLAAARHVILASMGCYRAGHHHVVDKSESEYEASQRIV